MTEDILAMVDWIKNKGFTHIAMESTGSYWKPIYNILEIERLNPMIVNANHIKNVPGIKTDVKDV
jgi:transposase